MAKDEDKKDSNFYEISGVVQYARLNKPDTKYKDYGEFSVTLHVDKATTKALADLGIKYKKNEGDDAAKGFAQVKLVRNAVNSEGKKAVIEVENLPDDVLLGRDSEVTVTFAAKKWSKGDQSGVRPILIRVVVDKLVPLEKTGASATRLGSARPASAAKDSAPASDKKSSKAQDDFPDDDIPF